MTMFKRAGSIFFLLLAALFLLRTEGTAQARDFFKPLRTDEPPVIDGSLDDPVWQKAPSVSGFKTFVPDFGKDPSERTVGYMAYDAENLYFAFRCHDREPDKIKAAVSNRDTIRPDDWICINLDTFNDQQSLYALYVNPLGIQMDSRYGSGQEDFSVDIVWTSAGRIDSEGYSIELRVPFKSIRYAGKARVEMSIFFERRISRRSEQVSYPPLDPAQGFFFLSQMMPLELLDIEKYTLLEILPAFTYGQRHERIEGDLFREPAATDLSLTGKLGITPQLILDATWNPDFSQVEADAGQVDVNLRYDLYFPEKRPFFLEGNEMFLHAGSSADDPLQAVVHTRTIVDPRVGFKLTGKIGQKDTIASIFALDESPSLDPSWTPENERFAGFAVLRYKRALADEGFLGAFYTGREYEGGFNQVAGADGQVRINKSSIIGFHGFGSWTKADREADIEAGTALSLNYLYDTRSLGINVGFTDVSRDFQTDAGYLTRNGIASVLANVAPKIYPKSRFFRKLIPQLSLSVRKDLYYDMYETEDVLAVQALLPGNTVVTAMGGYSTEVFLGERFDTSAWLVQTRSQVTKKLSVEGLFRRGGAVRYLADPYQGYGSRASAGLTYKPSDKLDLTLSWNYSDFFVEETREKEYDYSIWRGRLTYQMNKYLFFRGILEYNTFREELLSDFLASFTYIPGTVIQFGYGALHNRLEWDGVEYRPSERFLEMRRGIFFKASYLWRL
jgi:hypothetical protein